MDGLLLYLPNFIVSGRGVQNLASSRSRKARCEVWCLIIVVGDITTFTGAHWSSLELTGAHWSSLELTCHWSHTWVDWMTMTVRGSAPLQSPSLVIARNHFTAITINICPGSWPAAAPRLSPASSGVLYVTFLALREREMTLFRNRWEASPR